MEVFDGATGEARQAEIFVAVLGASSYTYAEATWSQALPDWIGVHVNALAFFGGAPRQIVCDNLRSGITRACFYEPMINRTYADMAAHYDTAVIRAIYVRDGQHVLVDLDSSGKLIFETMNANREREAVLKEV